MNTKENTVPFIIHKHNARNTNEHFDLRFLDLKNKKLLHSFAIPKNFEDIFKNKKSKLKTLCIKTRDHDPRWLTLDSYRLSVFDKGDVVVKISAPKFFSLEFHGKILKGNFILFNLSKKNKRTDEWILIEK